MHITVSDVVCPKCGSGELHPTKPNKLLIRAFKVYAQGRWWSHCLVCAGYYNPATLEVVPDAEERWKTGDFKGGWF